MNKNNWITCNNIVSCCSFIKHYKFNKPVKNVFIKITSMGWYHLHINNVRVDKDVFSPGYTDFKKRVQYQTYDISSLVNKSIDLKIDVGEGWGGGNHFSFAKGMIYFPMSINFEIDVIFKDNSNKKFFSDDKVKIATNKIIRSTIYGGEEQDYRRKAKNLGHAKKIKINSDLIPQEGEAIIFGEEFKARKMWKAPNGDLLIDFGQNISGMIKVSIKGKAGDKISYTPCEVLDKDGNFYRDNYRKAESFYSFILSGKKEVLLPEFSFLGGRYIKLIDYPSYIKKENFSFVFVHSNLKQTCSFKCENKKINRLYLNTYYGQLGNFLDIPTDCPQRDERLGWTGDAQVFARTAAIHFDVRKFFNKWINDMIVGQLPNGGVPGIIPKIKNLDLISSGWGDAAFIVPSEMYRAYGDKEILLKSKNMIERWIDFLSHHYKKPYIVDLPNQFGDWLALDKKTNNNYKGLTRSDLISTAYFAYGLRCLNEINSTLGTVNKKYINLYEKVVDAYQKEFIKNHHMLGHKAILFKGESESAFTQTGIALTLHFGLCDEKDRKVLVNDLVNLIKESNGCLTTGFLGTPYLLYALSDNGRSDIAYDLLFQEKFPSWLYGINKGATTMWEHYDGIKEDGTFWSKDMNSFNHYAYGSVFSWIFENCVGIKPVKPGYKEILIEPLIDKRLGGIHCKYCSSYGSIVVEWKISGGKVKYKIKKGNG